MSWNLPDGVSVSDLPGNGSGECEDCEGTDGEYQTCLVCDLQLCGWCYDAHLEKHEDEKEAEDDDEQ